MNTTKEFELLSDKDIEDMKAAFEQAISESVTTKAQENLDYTESPKINIAITGETWSGKSTIVNAIRGLDDEDEGAAKTEVTEKTMKPTKYPHPKHPNVILWDLPGFGTPNFKVNVTQYIIFIIIVSECFTENHAKLAHEIQKMGKKFYVVRSKIDTDIDRSRRRRKSTFNEEKLLHEIRKNCVECLLKEGVESPPVYLLCSFELGNFDFPSLMENLDEEISEHSTSFLGPWLSIIDQPLRQRKKTSLTKSFFLASPKPFVWPSRSLDKSGHNERRQPCHSNKPLSHATQSVSSLTGNPSILMEDLQINYYGTHIALSIPANCFGQALCDTIADGLCISLHNLGSVVVLVAIKGLPVVGNKKIKFCAVYFWRYTIACANKVYQEPHSQIELLATELQYFIRNARNDFEIVSKQELKEMSTAFELGGWENVASKIQENLDYIEKVKLHIAITGESGSGKSTFVNAMRGLKDEDEGAAETGVTETTMKPTKYPHPKHPKVNLWDLPGIGTPNVKADEYLQQVNFSQYDFFIIIASERFKENHAKLACEIQKMGKKFYFVCSKVDSEIAALKKRKKSTFSEVLMLEEVRKNSIECLQKQGVERPLVYLVSCLELAKFDFIKLQETLQQELSAPKRDAFLLSLPTISKTILLRKKELLGSQIWKLATVSYAMATLPIPGL
uniref:IRG-type G domain-containing protein n=1 Tax=Latimeria chalumnae TaxID=7897 RepID=H3BA62_LATCH